MPLVPINLYYANLIVYLALVPLHRPFLNQLTTVFKLLSSKYGALISSVSIFKSVLTSGKSSSSTLFGDSDSSWAVLLLSLRPLLLLRIAGLVLT